MIIRGKTHETLQTKRRSFFWTLLYGRINGILSNHDYAYRLIVDRTLAVEDYKKNTPYCDGISGTEVNASLWALSTKEAVDIAGGILEKSQPIILGNRTYWLRSPGAKNNLSAFVFSDGFGNGICIGDFASIPSLAVLGVRPALWVNLESAIILSGSGTAEDPYVLGVKESLPLSNAEEGYLIVKVDGKVLTLGVDYNWANGKIVLDLISELLSALEDGEHTHN